MPSRSGAERRAAPAAGSQWRWAAFLALFACAIGCRVPPGEPAGPRPDAGELVERIQELLLEPKVVPRAGAARSGRSRHALLIAADRYLTPGGLWDLPSAGESALKLKDFLQEKAGFSDVELLEGPEVSESTIRSRLLERIAPSIEGPDNLLVVWFAGHGMADEKGRARLFQWDTRAVGEPGAPRFENTLGYADLQGWVAEARESARKERGAELTTVVIVDACRIGAGAPPPDMVMEARADVTIHSCKLGQFALAGPEGLVFSDRLCQSLSALSESRDRVFLEDAFAQARAETRRSTGEQQEPEIRASRRGIPISARDDLRVDAVVLDGWLRGRRVSREVEGARVFFNGRESSAGLREGRYTLTASAPGYITFESEVEISREDDGRRLEILLSPALVVVSARVLDAEGHPAPGAVLEATGVRGRIEGYHKVAATAAADGVALLALPPAGGGQRLVLKSGQRVAQRLEASLEDGSYRSLGGQSVPVLDLGDLVLAPGARRLAGAEVKLEYAAPSAGAMELGVPAKVEFPRVSGLPPYLDSMLSAARRLLEGGKVERALETVARARNDPAARRGKVAAPLAQLEQALRLRRVIESSAKGRSALEAMLAQERPRLEGKYREAADRALANLDFAGWEARREGAGLDEATERFETRRQEWGSSEARRVFGEAIAGALLERAREEYEGGRWRQALAHLERAEASYGRATRAERLAIWREEARQRFDAGDLEEAEKALRAAQDLAEEGPRRAAIAEERRIVLLARVEEAYRRAYAEGGWKAARELVGRAGRDYPGDRDLERLARKVERESIEPATRSLLRQASEEYARGDKGSLEEAERLYVKALSGANAHYRPRILRQLGEVADRLFRLYLNLATEAELSGRKEVALRARLRCADYYPGAVLDDIERASRFVPREKVEIPEGFLEAAAAFAAAWSEAAGAEEGRPGEVVAIWDAYLASHPGPDYPFRLRARALEEEPRLAGAVLEPPVGRPAAEVRMEAARTYLELWPNGTWAERIERLRRTILSDRAPPRVELQVVAPGEPARPRAGLVQLYTERARLLVSASDDVELSQVTLSGIAAKIEPGRKTYRKEGDVTLSLGENRFRLEATDTAGNRASTEVLVVRLAEPPPPVEGFTPLAKNAQGYEEYRHEKTGLVFVLLPGGKFRMGSPDSEAGRDDGEGPVHEVTLGPFLLAKTEVPQSAWERVMGSNPSKFKGADRPVEQVSWNDCREFCEKTGLRLPSEAEWEYACRAGSETPFSFGGTITPGQVDYDGIVPYGGGAEGRFREETVAVGSLPANGFGLHEMHGNVWEWCEDVCDPDFYEKPEAKGPDPVSTSGSSVRVIRGGSWCDNARFCRSAYRNWRSPSYRYSILGLRPSRPLR